MRTVRLGSWSWERPVTHVDTFVAVPDEGWRHVSRGGVEHRWKRLPDEGGAAETWTVEPPLKLRKVRAEVCCDECGRQYEGEDGWEEREVLVDADGDEVVPQCKRVRTVQPVAGLLEIHGRFQTTRDDPRAHPGERLVVEHPVNPEAPSPLVVAVTEVDGMVGADGVVCEVVGPVE